MDGLFPLPLAPFEEYLLADDQRGYPMAFVIQMMLRNEVQREAFEEAVADALQRHPLLQSTIIFPKKSRAEWIRQPRLRPRIDWGGYDDPVECDEPFIDLKQEIGLRMWCRIGGGHSRLVVQFHHSCCDAFGALAFMTDVAAHYGRYFPSQVGTWSLSETHPEKLLNRDELCVHHHQPVSQRRFAWNIIKGAVRIVLRTPATVAAPRRMTASLPASFPGLTTHRCEADLYPRLRKYARRRSCTVNDVLICELMRTLREWNRRHDPHDRTKWLTILMPTNLRNADHEGMPAANVAGYSFVLRAAADCDRPEELLDGIRRESEFVKNWRYSALFISCLRIILKAPRLLRLILALPRPAATAVLSYVGDPSRMLTSRLSADADGLPMFGNVKVLDIAAAPPVRHLTRTSFGVWHLNDVLQIGLNADPQWFGRSDAEQLLEMFAARLTAAVASTELSLRRQAAA